MRNGQVPVAVLLVVLAGCAVVPGPSSPPSESPEPFDSPASSDSPAATPSSGATPTTSPVPVTIDGDELADRNVDALRESGSFTQRGDLTVRVGDRTFEQVLTTKVNFTGDRIAESRVGTYTFPNYSRYGNGEYFYQRQWYTPEKSDVRYFYWDLENYWTNAPPVRPRQVLASISAELRRYVDGASGWQRVGTEVYEGHRVTRYRAGNASTHFSALYGRGTVTEFRATLLVDADGVVRVLRYEWTATSDEGVRTGTLEIRHLALGTTVVERPTWVDEAKEEGEEQTDVGASGMRAARAP